MQPTKQNFFLFLSVLIVLLPFAILATWPSQKLTFIACNVGQGDAILVTKGNDQVLVDGGPDSKVLTCLSENMPFWDKTIELVVNTHPDADHLTGLIEVIKNYEVKNILINSNPISSGVFEVFHEQILDQKIPVYSPEQDDQVKVGEINLQVLWPQEKIGNIALWQDNLDTNVLGDKTTSQKTNENSIVVHLQYQDFDAVLTGDITSREEEQIIKNYEFKNIEILKIAHHGSKYSSTEEFLEAVYPQTAIISVGKNPWGHPTKEVLGRLESLEVKILRTDKKSAIVTYLE